MTASENIRDQILQALHRQDANPALASEYSRVCRDLNRRLEQIEAVLDQGDEVQALQMAEIYPPVMEEADILSFFKSTEWSRFCERNQIPVAPEIRIHGVSKLNTLYGKGISSTHPIYKQLREAVLARNDEKALVIARTIESLSPGDTGAKAERERLERKVFAGLVSELGRSLTSGDTSKILSLLDTIEQVALVEEADGSAEVRSARKIREERDAHDAKERVLGMLAQLDMHSDLQDWRATMEQVSLIQNLCQRHAIQLDAVQQGILGNAREFSESKRSASIKQAAFDEAWKTFLVCLDDASSRTQASGTLTIEETSELLMRLNKEWQVVESFGMPVDPARLEETSRLVEILRNELTRLQKRRVSTIAALSAAALLILTLVGWFVSVQYRAGEMSKGLVSGRESRSLASVKRLADEAEKSSLARFSPRLSSEIATSRKWLEGVEKEVVGCSEVLTNLLKRSNGFSAEDPVRLESEYQGLKSRAGQLPDEQQKVMQPDILKLDKAYSDHLAILGAKDDKILGEQLAMHGEKSKPLDAGGLTLESLESILASRQELENAWASIVHSPIKDLPVSAALKAKAEAAEEVTKKLSLKAENVRSALKAMDAANKPSAFKSALGVLKDVDLPCCRLISDARIAWNSDCTSDSLLRELLFPGNPGAYESLKQATSDDGESRRLFPKSILPGEVSPFAQILNDECTPDVKVYSLDGGDPSRAVYAKLEISTAIDDGDLSVFTGKTYDPKKDSETKPEFSIKTYRASGKGWEKAKKFTGGSESQASKVYRDLGLKDVVSDSLEVHVSPVQLLDRLIHSEAKDPVYQAFVIQQLLEMTSKRPYAWGLQYSPGATKVMKDVDQVIRVNCGTLPQGAWMSPAYQKLNSQLKPFLEKPRRFNAEAQLNKLLDGLALADGAFVYAGYVGGDGKVRLMGDTVLPPADLYGMSGGEGRGNAVRVYCLKPGTLPPAYEQMAKPMPLTPLYYLKNGRANMVDSGLHALRIENMRSEITLPPLFEDPITAPVSAESGTVPPESGKSTISPPASKHP